MITYLGYRLLELFVLSLPYPLAYIVAHYGAMLWFATGTNVDYIKKNVSIVLKKNINDPEVHKIAKEVFIHWGKNIADFLKHKVISPDTLRKRIRLEGIENLDNALKKGKGVVIFTCHVGNFEWGACRLAIDGYKIWGVSLVRKSEMTNRFFESMRLSKGLKTLYINRMIHVFKYLKDNEIVAIPTDWDPTGRAARQFDLFDHRANLPAGAVYIALKSGAELIPSFIWREGKYTHHQVIGEPIRLDRTGEKEEMLKKNMKKVIPAMEKYVSEHISEWELFHDIWEG